MCSYLLQVSRDNCRFELELLLLCFLCLFVILSLCSILVIKVKCGIDVAIHLRNLSSFRFTEVVRVLVPDLIVWTEVRID